jgi:hypothetical protein
VSAAVSVQIEILDPLIVQWFALRKLRPPQRREISDRAVILGGRGDRISGDYR